MRYQQIVPFKIELNFKLQNSLFVLLHEIAHCLSPLVWRKTKQEWVYKEHDRVFYEKLWEVVKIALKIGVYNKEFESMNHLMSYDQSV